MKRNRVDTNKSDRNLGKIQAVAFDLGHTLVDEELDRHLPVRQRRIRLMPGVEEVLPRIQLPMAVWANTRFSREPEVRLWLARAAIEQYFAYVITSCDAGARKPTPQFFDYALRRCSWKKESVLFVGNQLNTDVVGGVAYGIKTAWLSGEEYRSVDDEPCSAPASSYELRSLIDLLDVLACA